MEILVITDGVVNVIVTVERNLAVSAQDGIWSMTMKVIIFDPQISFRSKSPRETLACQTNRHLLGDSLQLCFSSFTTEHDQIPINTEWANTSGIFSVKYYTEVKNIWIIVACINKDKCLHFE